MEVQHTLGQCIHFVLPEDKNLPSGGNIYNAQLINALQQAGQEVKIISFAEYSKAIAERQKGIFGVDSLFVDDLQSLDWEKSPGFFSFFIMHHLLSLHPPAGVDGKQLFEEREKKVLLQFDAILASSEFSRDYLKANGISVPTVVVEPASASAAGNRHLSQSLPLRGLMVANVVERKGILALLEALEKLSAREDQFILNIIGRQDMEPDYFSRCEALVQHSHLQKKVQFGGPLSYAKTLRQYAKHHLLISAAHMETFGMAIQEAKSSGLPLLLLNGGYSSRHLTAKHGKLCRNIFELAENFIELSKDPDEFKVLKNAALQQQQEAGAYNWQSAAALFLNKFRNFL